MTGLGETYYVPGAVEAVLHDLIGAARRSGWMRAASRTSGRRVFACMNFHGWAGAEARALSALDIALWDLLGKRTGLSVATLLGGRVRDSIRVYNTCVDAGPYRDMQGWLERPGELAEELVEAGFTGMKVWPWDRFAPQITCELVTGPAGWSAMGPVGHDLTPDQLAAGSRVRRGDPRPRRARRLDVMVEAHSRWDVNAALAICRALEPYGVAWIEDVLQPTSAADLRTARARDARSAGGQRAVDRQVGVPRRARGRCGAARDGRRRVDGRPDGGAQDRRSRRRLPPAGRAARLHRPCLPRRLAPALRARDEREGDGGRTRLRRRLVPRRRRRPAGSRRRPRDDPRSRRGSACRCCPRSAVATTRRFGVSAA